MGKLLREHAHPAEPNTALTTWLLQAQAGDLGAFGSLTQHLAPRLVRYAMGFLSGDIHAANDIVQETMIAAWKYVQRFEDTDHLKAWLHRVTRYRSVSWIRRRGPGGRPIRSIYDRETARDVQRTPARTALSHTSGLPDDPLLHALRRALIALPPRYIAPIRLHYLLGHDTRETANLLGISLTALKMRLHRARNSLRRTMEVQAHAVGDPSIATLASMFRRHAGAPGPKGAASQHPGPGHLPGPRTTEGDSHESRT